MKTGMLWFDNDAKRTLAEKVERAAAYYQKKYGRRPSLCFVHPSMLQGDAKKAGEIALEASRQVLPNHFWLGFQEG